MAISTRFAPKSAVAEVPSESRLHENLVTVVIPARDEEAFIGRCLDSILSQDHPNLQVIVVDGASTDRTPEIIRRYADRDSRVEMLNNPEAIIPKSLNLALSAARAPWFIRVDAHATIPPAYISTALRHLRTGQWGAVGGRKDGVGVTSAGRAIAGAMSSRFGVGNSTYHYGSDIQVVEHVPFGAYPTEMVRELGGWDERLKVNQDFEFDYRVRKSGRKLLFDPNLTVHWHCRQSIADLFQQYRRYGRGKAMVARLHPDSLRVRHLMAPALVASWATALTIAPRRPWLAAAGITPYFIALAIASAYTVRKVSGSAAQVRVPVAFLTMHAGWGLGFWEGVIHSFASRRPQH